MPSVHAFIINNELATEHGWGELADVCVQYQLLKYLNSIVINIKHHIFITTEYYSNNSWYSAYTRQLLLKNFF